MEILTWIFHTDLSCQYVMTSNKNSSTTGSYAVDIITYISSNSIALKLIIKSLFFSTSAGVVDNG